MTSQAYKPKVEPRNVALVGIRDLDSKERRFVKESGVHVFTMRDIDERGMREVMAEALRFAGDDTDGIAVSLDMDFVDPSDAPGVGTPVRGGVTYREAHLAMEMIADSRAMVSLRAGRDQSGDRSAQQDGAAGRGDGRSPGWARKFYDDALRRNLRVGVLFGGRSGEHEVSLASAASVIRALDPEKYEAVPIGITKDGRWLVGSGAQKLLAEVLKSGERVLLPPDPTAASLVPLTPTPGHPSVTVDVMFPVLHGTFGEDGTVQGLLELAGLPYVGAGVLASAVGMDKDVQKRLFAEAGLPIVPFLAVRRSEWERERVKVLKRSRRNSAFRCS